MQNNGLLGYILVFWAIILPTFGVQVGFRELWVWGASGLGRFGLIQGAEGLGVRL